MNAFRLSGIVAIIAMTVMPVAAHHSFSAEYNDKKPVKLKGKVAEMSGPIRTRGSTSRSSARTAMPEKWAWETGGANALYRRGWRKEDLVAGTVLVVDGYQARNGSKTANATSITFEDGKRLFAGSSNQNAATK